ECPWATTGRIGMRKPNIITSLELRSEEMEQNNLRIQAKYKVIEEKEVRYKITEHDFRTYGESVIDKLNEYALTKDGWKLADDSREGVRVSLDKEHGNGWFLLRLSVHDPIMPLNIESNDVGGVAVILEQVEEFIKTCEGLTL
ncbi:MAG: phosphomannomutase/phosphoglucomutase, partial [Clostridia bacterium]|nr:phosphomannomutase/phosphoglucomutase [Clostridia bacterium]